MSSDTTDLHRSYPPAPERRSQSAAPAFLGGGLLLLALFLISGASGLVYQVVWSRSLTLVFGSTTQGVATVLAAFMGGLAIGSWIASRIGDGVSAPLKLYGILEGGIAILSLAVLLLMPVLDYIYPILYGWVRLSFTGLTLVRLVLAAAFLLPATTLMGATLPLLSACLERRGRVAGQGASLLYAFNTIGAVVGTAGAGFLLLPRLGVTSSTLVAAGGNLIAALGALYLSRKVEEEGRGIRIPFTSKPAAGDAETGAPLPEGTKVAVAAAIAVSGAGALILEVSWTRTLSLILGSSTQAFTIMLATFLVGLAAGSALAGRYLGRVRDPAATFALVELGAGVTAYAGVFLFPELPYAFLQLFRVTREAPELFQLGRFGLAASVMLAPTLLLGATFPLAVRCQRLGARDAARPVGFLYAVNTVGAIVGSLAAGFFLVPVVGLRQTLVAGALVNLVVGAFLLAMSGRARRSVRWAVAGAVFILMPGLPLGAPVWNPLVMTSGVFQYAPRFADLFPTRAKFLEYHAAHSQLYYRDGRTTTVTVEKRPMSLDGKVWLVLTVNGKVDASSVGDMPTQILLGQAPMLLAPDPKRILVIGWGSGITVGSALTHDRLESLHAVEIEEAVIEASSFFDEHNGRASADPRVTIQVNDARHALLVDDEQYDVIISEPSNPWISGPARLFTREFFEILKERLAPGGILCQWVQLYGLDLEAYATLLRTLSESFEDVMIMAGSAGDTLVMASNSPIRLDLAEIRRRMERPEVARDLARIGVRDLPALLAHYRAGGESLRERVGAGPLNTDDNALVEFAAARTLYRTHHDDTEETLFHASSSPLDRADISGLTPAEAAMLPVAMARAWLDADLPERAKEALKRGAGGRDLQPTLDAQMAAARGDLLERLGDGEGARAAWEAALLADPGSLEGGLSLGRALQKEPETLPRAVSLLSRVAKAHPRDARVRLELGRALAASQRHDEAIVALNEAAGLDPMPETEPFIHMEWGRACFATGDPDCAIREISRYFREWREVPKPAQLSVDAALDLGQALLMKGDKVRAMEQFRVAAELGGTLANWHRGQSDEALRIDEGELAEYHLRKAIEWNALDARAYHNLGAILTNQGRWEEALETWAALLERRPDDARALRGLIAAMHQLGREEQMVPHLEHLIQVEEDPERLMALQLSLDRLRAGEPISQAPSPDTD